VRRHRQIVLRIRRRLVTPLVSCPNAVLLHQPINPRLAGRKTAIAQFLRNARTAIGTLKLGVDGADQCQHLCIRQPLALWRATTLPAAVAADADCQHPAQLGQLVLIAMRIDPSVLHSASFAKYAAAFFRISFSRLSRTFSARTLESSICSGVTGFAPGPLSLPASYALTQLRSVCSISPSSFATAPAVWPAFTRLTANSRNSGVYSCFGIFFNFVAPSNLPGPYTPSLGRRNFGGSSPKGVSDFTWPSGEE